MMRLMTFCAALALLSGCGIEGAIKRNDDRYMQPGALDMPLTGIYRTHQFNLLDRYRVTHQWVTSSGCGYRGVERPDIRPGVRSWFFVGRDIYESEGKTWLRFEGMTPFDFDPFVRSVKRQQPIYAPATKEEVDASNKAQWERIERERKAGRFELNPPDALPGRKPIRHEEMEIGFKALCGETWQATHHSFTLFLHKRDLASWRAKFTEESPNGKWTERRIGSNVWTVQETAEQDFKKNPRGFEGPFQTWLLPIGDTGYILALKLSANHNSLKYPEAHARFQATFRHLIESVKIEPLNADHPDNSPPRKPAP